MHTTISTEELIRLYSTPEACAQIVGLRYISGVVDGYGRRKAGKGFTFTDSDGKALKNKKQITWIKELVIPPAWQEVWIAADTQSHILATGIDERGRKQYIYHPKWRVARDLLKFYRMIMFAEQLPLIRNVIRSQLEETNLSQDKVMAAMLWILDNTYIRIGNDIYLEENDSVGLTTLADHNIVIAGPVVTFSFKAKSGKEQQFSLENKAIARIMTELKRIAGERFFQYVDEDETIHPIDASDVNKYLNTITKTHVTAKDFRTWGGTLMAFDHLVENDDSKKKPEKIIVGAVDSAAQVLGNTRSVAKSSYVHPHILSTYGSKNFEHYFTDAKTTRKKRGLDKRETELAAFLRLLFKEEFDLLAK